MLYLIAVLRTESQVLIPQWLFLRADQQFIKIGKDRPSPQLSRPYREQEHLSKWREQEAETDSAGWGKNAPKKSKLFLSCLKGRNVLGTAWSFVLATGQKCQKCLEQNLCFLHSQRHICQEGVWFFPYLFHEGAHLSWKLHWGQGTLRSGMETVLTSSPGPPIHRRLTPKQWGSRGVGRRGFLVCSTFSFSFLPFFL